MSLSPSVTLRREWLDRALGQQPLTITPDDRADRLPDDQDEAERPDLAEEPLPLVGNATSLAEERAAKKAGLAPSYLREIALRLWGRSLEQEAQHRAGPESSSQARRRVTRVLVNEIRAAADKKES